MKAKGQLHNLQLRPHFKTHQSLKIGSWFRDEGIDKITVSSMKMAKYFASDGWKDITLAFPLIPQWIKELKDFDSNININILIDSNEVAFLLKNLPGRNIYNVFVKVDCGYNRAGVSVLDHNSILELAKIIQSNNRCIFKGVLIHQGDNYKIHDINTLQKAYHKDMHNLYHLMKRLKECYPSAICSWGDTPSCTVVNDFGVIDEIRPGNFIFYDLMQYASGICTVIDIAIVVKAIVASVYPDAGKMLLHCGAVHLSKERLNDPESLSGYGIITKIDNNKRGDMIQGLKIESLSQEHGVVKGEKALVREFKPGDFVGIVPVHSCLTADILKEYTTTKGEKISMMPLGGIKN